MEKHIHQVRIGRRNISALYAFAGTSRLWFDGGLWVVYLQHKGITLFEIGLLEAILHVAAVVSDVPVGIFADKYGWKLSLSISTLLGIAYTTLCLGATNIWLFALAFAARGLQVTFTNGSDASIAYESSVWAGHEQRYLRISSRLFAISLVSMGVAEAIGGSLANWAWASVYIAFTMANVISFVVVLFIREPRAARINSNEEHISAMTIATNALRFARTNRSFAKWIAFSTILSGFVATFSFYGQSLLLQNGWTLVTLGILTGIDNGVGAVVSWLSERFVRFFGERSTITSAGLIAGIGLLLFAWIPGFGAGVGYLLSSSADNLAEPIVDAGLNRIVPSAQRATLLSAHSTGFSLFMIIGFPLFGALAQAYGIIPAAHQASIFAILVIVFVTYWWNKSDLS